MRSLRTLPSVLRISSSLHSQCWEHNSSLPYVSTGNCLSYRLLVAPSCPVGFYLPVCSSLPSQSCRVPCPLSGDRTPSECLSVHPPPLWGGAPHILGPWTLCTQKRDSGQESSWLPCPGDCSGLQSGKPTGLTSGLSSL